MAEIHCVECDGARLNSQARHFRLDSASPKFADNASLTISQICDLSIADTHEFFAGLDLDDTKQFVATEPIKEIRNRLSFLIKRRPRLSDAQSNCSDFIGRRDPDGFALPGQIGAGLVGVLYILDEPSIGLHPRDNDRLISTLQHLARPRKYGRRGRA